MDRYCRVSGPGVFTGCVVTAQFLSKSLSQAERSVLANHQDCTPASGFECSLPNSWT